MKKESKKKSKVVAVAGHGKPKYAFSHTTHFSAIGINFELNRYALNYGPYSINYVLSTWDLNILGLKNVKEELLRSLKRLVYPETVDIDKIRFVKYDDKGEIIMEEKFNEV